MAKGFMLFPSLTEDFANRIRIQSKETEFYYTNREDEEFELMGELLDQSSCIYKLTDTLGIWTQDDYNFGIRKKYLLRTFQCLFGPEGIACKDAKIGLALVWTSADSKQRGIIEVGQFGSEDLQMQNEADVLFQKAQLRGRVDFSTVLYIACSGTPTENEIHLANTPGYILGEFENEKFSIQLDGNGSIFPVYERPEEGQPLWYVKCDWLDPLTDSFEESVSIHINTLHKNYRYIDRTQKTYDKQLLVEIMSSAISIVIETLRADEASWEEITSGENFEHGSVGEIIYYFKNTHNWELSTPQSVSLSIRRFFDQRL